MEERANGFHGEMSTRRQWRNGNVGRKADNAKRSSGKTLETDMRLIANDGRSKRSLKVGREQDEVENARKVPVVRSYVRASIGRRRNVEGVERPHEQALKRNDVQAMWQNGSKAKPERNPQMSRRRN
ncbi:hypothetical protein R1flu_010856 [Riccia fluitans]|uniref:Uncharacterized protein n=1 Tax=Riccia fluitans TaxID=41844 RepID=A0ABD1Z785_9MARC